MRFMAKGEKKHIQNQKASSGETHRGREESAWLGSGYYYAQMLPSYVAIFANILALITRIPTLICMTNDSDSGTYRKILSL